MPFLCPLTLEFGVIWYKTLIRENRELASVFIGPSASVRLRRRSRRRTVNRRVAGLPPERQRKGVRIQPEEPSFQ